ncbi:MAG TPA: type II CAAX endopeptidase family protein [Polyangium sp.]|nr:type II CAAX endopeptidase family protein [Polyangium sp.]
MHEATDKVRRARRGLAIFFGVLLLASVPFDVQIVLHGLHPNYFLPLVWVPCFASVVARFLLREGFGDVSFRLDRRAAWAMLVGVIYPVAVGVPAYGIAWTTGMAHFEPAAMHPLGFAIPGSTPGERLLAGSIIALTLGPLAMAVLALGEEVGWRGYMLTRLIDARVPQPVLVSGVIWALWHAPLIVAGEYNASPVPMLSLLLYMVTSVGAGTLLATLRLETGSVWPAVTMHAAWNAIVVAFFGASTNGEDAALWTGEGGVLVAISTTAITFVLLRWRRGPGDRARGAGPGPGTSELGAVRL